MIPEKKVMPTMPAITCRLPAKVRVSILPDRALNEGNHSLTSTSATTVATTDKKTDKTTDPKDTKVKSGKKTVTDQKNSTSQRGAIIDD